VTNIAYSLTTPFGRQTYTAVQAIRKAQSLLQSIKQKADDVTGGGVTPANLEDAAGANLFGVATGQGANYYAAIQALDAALFTTPTTWTPVQASVDLDQGSF